MHALKAEADKDKENKILLILLGAGHGFQKKGFQTLATNRYDLKDDFYELIQVERSIRDACKKHPNLYILAHYAACRDVIKE